jgi:hypothetical protein
MLRIPSVVISTAAPSAAGGAMIDGRFAAGSWRSALNLRRSVSE